MPMTGKTGSDTTNAVYDFSCQQGPIERFKVVRGRNLEHASLVQIQVCGP